MTEKELNVNKPVAIIIPPQTAINDPFFLFSDLEINTPRTK